jgi:predicted Zn-dependent protease
MEPRRVVTPLLLVAVASAGCATNPATGESQLMLVSEAQEIAIGREADAQVEPTYGLYPSPELQSYVGALGSRLAGASERPELPWSFKVVDDPSVNAFALPGGFIYVTRGLLAYLSSEAQLVAVLGHEVGHVTARHSASQLSRQQLASVGLLAGSLARPDLAEKLGGLAQTGLGLMFLKFGRDQERQADDLGLRYATREGYAGQEMLGVFRTFARLGEASRSSRLPSWLSTHPDPEDRIERLEVRAGAVSGLVRRDEYLRRLEGLVFGDNPREGFFRGAEFFQPELAFRVRFPEGFPTQNRRQAVLAQSPAQDALLELSLARGSSPEAAAREFLAGEGVNGSAWRATRINGLGAVTGDFDAVSGETRLRGRGAFIEMQGRVYRLLGYSFPARFDAHAGDVDAWLRSFRPLTDPDLLRVAPLRLFISSLQAPTTLAQFQTRYPSAVALDTLAVVNQVQADDRLPRGWLAKRVVGAAVQ